MVGRRAAGRSPPSGAPLQQAPALADALGLWRGHGQGTLPSYHPIPSEHLAFGVDMDKARSLAITPYLVSTLPSAWTWTRHAP